MIYTNLIFLSHRLGINGCKKYTTTIMLVIPNPFNIMFDPASANALATPRPIPLVEPVTNAILLLNIFTSIFNLDLWKLFSFTTVPLPHPFTYRTGPGII